MTASVQTHHELPCVGCGYALRGLDVDARCPECGKSVHETIAAQTLGSWPVAWLRQLRRGLALLTAALLVGWMAMLWVTVTDLGGSTCIVPALARVRGWHEWHNERAMVFPLTAAFALGVWGTAVVTFSEAARLVGRDRPRASLLARAGIVLGVLGFCGLVATFFLFHRGLRDSLIWVWLVLLIGAAIAVWN